MWDGDFLTGFIDSFFFHLSFSQVMLYRSTISSLRSFLILSSRRHKISVLHVITRSKISFHAHASKVDHAITCGKSSFHAITSNKSANLASRQIAWGATTTTSNGTIHRGKGHKVIEFPLSIALTIYLLCHSSKTNGQLTNIEKTKQKGKNEVNK